jgi:hypothetical protein
MSNKDSRAATGKAMAVFSIPLGSELQRKLNDTLFVQAVQNQIVPQMQTPP